MKRRIVNLVIRWYGRGLPRGTDCYLRHGAVSYFNPAEERGFLRIILLPRWVYRFCR